MKITYLSWLLGICLVAHSLKAQSVIQIQQNLQTSIRGLSVVNDNVAWASGSKGNIAITRDGGKTWNWHQIKGFEKAEFRDIEAFSDKEAIIISSGTPALILKTTNGGATWQVKYHNDDTAYFLDAMDFSDPWHGYVLGDPINNKFVLLATADGGDTWKMDVNRPVAAPGEAAFAASGTCLRIVGHNIFIVTGGSLAHILTRGIKYKKWITAPLPLLKGKNSQGAFSLAKGDNRIIVVGGDYQKDTQQDSTACYSTDPQSRWQLPNKSSAGFQSGVEYIDHDTFISTGTPGTNMSIDGGKTWKKIDNISYNVCRKAKHGKLVLLAGNGGKIGVLQMRNN